MQQYISFSCRVLDFLIQYNQFKHILLFSLVADVHEILLRVICLLATDTKNDHFLVTANFDVIFVQLCCYLHQVYKRINEIKNYEN